MFKSGLLLYSAKAIIDFPSSDKLSPGVDNTGSQEISCHGTIRSGLIYASTEFFSVHATGNGLATALNTGGFRCKDSIATGVNLCSNAYDAGPTLKTNFYASSAFTDK